MKERGQPILSVVYLFVRDMDASVAFYERLGLTITRIGTAHARTEWGEGARLEFGAADLTRSYDPNWREPSGPPTNTLNFTLPSRDAVGEMYEKLTSAGYAGHLAPIDAFWGQRFALVDDPDGNIVGLQSPAVRSS